MTGPRGCGKMVRIMDEMEVKAYNRRAWDRAVERGNQWTVPVTSEVISAARAGRWQVVLTPLVPVPRDWFPTDLAGVDILCLAAGGGQQAPILAAAGARVTVLDNAPRQLEQDRLVAARDGLVIDTVLGDMADLSAFADARFDLVFHPVSNCFAPRIRPVWQETFRVLRPGGALLAGFFNPATFLVEDPWTQEEPLRVVHALPYADTSSIDDDRRQAYLDQEEPLVFGHTLTDQLGGQMDAGLVLAGMYEDHAPDALLSRYMPMFLATRAVKPARGSSAGAAPG